MKRDGFRHAAPSLFVQFMFLCRSAAILPLLMFLTGSGIRASNALDTLFLFLHDVPHREEDDGHKYDDRNNGGFVHTDRLLSGMIIP
jgi:hypothetical protein